MVDNVRHRVKLIEILKDIYDDPGLRTSLGFKGGTAAMLFYDLPRLSVDLDFNLLKEGREELVVKKLKKILANHGTLRETTKKHFTLFFLLSYEQGERTIKVEISRRATESGFSPQTYLGIPMLVMNQEDMAAGKLSALITRRKPAMRDVFDTWFFLKNKWPVNDRFFQQQSGLSLDAGLRTAIEHVSIIRKNQILQGLGELLDERQKSWVRDKLVKETVFQLKLLRESRRLVS